MMIVYYNACFSVQFNAKAELWVVYYNQTWKSANAFENSDFENHIPL